MRRRQIWVLSDTVWPFDFSFVGHLLGFISMGNVSAKILRFMKLFVRKNGSGRFSQILMFLLLIVCLLVVLLFSPVFCLTESFPFGCG